MIIWQRRIVLTDDRCCFNCCHLCNVGHHVYDGEINDMCKAPAGTTVSAITGDNTAEGLTDVGECQHPIPPGYRCNGSP